jgi:pyruvate/2-oxoglutarate dehydrogenase complex dihydrolipoamide dehydrogenase (E3) component
MTASWTKDVFDLVCIGGGVGGLVAASAAAQLGARVALVEKTKALGGDCVHWGCVPTKALVRAGKIASLLRRAGEFGIRTGDGLVEVDFPAVMRRMRHVQEQAAELDRPERFQKMGVEVVFGAGRFLSPHIFEVGDRRLAGRRFLVATGSRPIIPPIPGVETIEPHTNETILRLDRLPRSLLVIGAGPIGLELAQVFARLGTKVIVLEKMGQVLPREDEELAATLQAALEAEGIEIHTCVDIEASRRAGGKRCVEANCKLGGRRTFEAEEVLFAIGRAPNIEGLGLEAAGVRIEKKGIPVDARMRTNVPHIFAVGDVTGLFPFTHMAEYEAGIAVANALFPAIGRRADFRALPWVTFTDPELARAGLTEAEAREKHGDSVRAYRFEIERFDRAMIEGETRGLLKIVCSKKGKILGAHILAPDGGEILQEYVLAMAQRLPIGAIARTIHPYPALVQAAKRAAEQYYREKLFCGRAAKIARALVRFGRLFGRGALRAEIEAAPPRLAAQAKEARPANMPR